MSAVEIELVGGPHDGARLSTGLRLPLIWTNGRQCYRKPGRRRALYRLMAETAQVSRFRFIGNTHVMCECGGLRSKHKSCPICGSA